MMRSLPIETDPAAVTARLPWVLLGVTAVLILGVMLPLSVGQEPALETVSATLALTFGAAGALIASSQPRNAIGWIFCALGVWNGVIQTWETFAYHSLPTGAAAEWVFSWSWLLDLALFTLVFLLFPTGRLAVWLLGAACLFAVPGQALSIDSGQSEFASGSNPLGVDSPAVQVAVYAGFAMILAVLAVSVGSLVVRYRRAVGFERQQLKQLVFAAGVILTLMSLALPFYYESAVVRAVTELAFVALPIAVCLAILRHRLYDIDVVIRRTVVYGVLTLTLAASYLGTVLVLQALLSPGSDFAIAGSTLAVAALVRPVRTRIQSLVDRRFFRRRYDAVQTIEEFGARLRDEVELGALSDDLRRTVRDTMQPAHVSLWLRGPKARA